MDRNAEEPPLASGRKRCDTTIALCAIAKDEGAYLPEWVLYHRWWGFGRIHVMLNGITDNSLAIMQKLAAALDGVSFETVDQLKTTSSEEIDELLIPSFFRRRNPLQARAYAHAYARSKSLGWDYVLFGDIDEFFFDRPGRKVDEVIHSLGHPDLLYLRWFNCAGDEEEFSRLARRRIWGRYMRNVKFLIRTGLEPMKFLTPHEVSLPPECRQAGPTRQTLMLHRYYRSRLEYLALLSRGDTIINDMTPLKLNRSGWWRRGLLTIAMKDSLIVQLRQFVDEGIQRCGLEGDLEIAKSHVRERAAKTTKEFERMRKLNASLYPLVGGTGLTFIPPMSQRLYDGFRRMLGRFGFW
jgi:hypothetical protein